jgi:mRNA interferase MazF
MNQYDIYLADLNPTIGREQFGKRPVLIISNDYENLLDIVTIIPITSLKNGRRIYPNELLLQSELERPSILLCQQIRTISKHRLIKKLTSIDNYITRKKILNILCFRFEDVN